MKTPDLLITVKLDTLMYLCITNFISKFGSIRVYTFFVITTFTDFLETCVFRIFQPIAIKLDTFM
jgi:hypothetical protein